jgi:hypothetical protein
MLALMTLFAMMAAGVVCLVAFVAALAIFKVAIHAVFWPLKLLLLPFLLVALVIKLVIIITVVAVVAAVLIPLAILAMLFVGPFLLIGALT